MIPVKYQIGDIILVEPEKGLLKQGDGFVGEVVKVNYSSDYVVSADFRISKGVHIEIVEIVKILNKEEHPEYYL